MTKKPGEDVRCALSVAEREMKPAEITETARHIGPFCCSSS